MSPTSTRSWTRRGVGSRSNSADAPPLATPTTPTITTPATAPLSMHTSKRPLGGSVRKGFLRLRLSPAVPLESEGAPPPPLVIPPPGPSMLHIALPRVEDSPISELTGIFFCQGEEPLLDDPEESRSPRSGRFPSSPKSTRYSIRPARAILEPEDDDDHEGGCHCPGCTDETASRFSVGSTPGLVSSIASHFSGSNPSLASVTSTQSRSSRLLAKFGFSRKRSMPTGMWTPGPSHGFLSSPALMVAQSPPRRSSTANWWDVKSRGEETEEEVLATA